MGRRSPSPIPLSSQGGREVSEFETQYAIHMVCPHCGYEDPDSWEYADDGEGEVDCKRCEKPFTFTVDISVTYSTTKTPTQEGAKDEE